MCAGSQAGRRECTQGSSAWKTPRAFGWVPGWPGEHLLFLALLTAGSSRTGHTPAQRSCLCSSSRSEALSVSPRKEADCWGFLQPPRQLQDWWCSFPLNVAVDHTLVPGFHKAKASRDCDPLLRDRGRKEKGGVAEGGREKAAWQVTGTSQTKNWDTCFGKKQGTRSFPCCPAAQLTHPAQG